jgi:signal transduction histidine kinase
MLRARNVPPQRRSATLSRMLVVLMGLVVVSFLSAFVTGRLRGSTIDRDLNGIVKNAMPSVALLSLARGDLHRLDSYADAFVDAAAASVAIPVEPMARYRQSMEDTLAKYRDLPSFAGEREIQGELGGRLQALDAANTRIVAAVHTGDLAAAEQGLLDEQHLAEETDGVLERLVDLNARAGQNLAMSISRTRSRTIAIVTAIDFLAVLLAAITTTLAAIILRRSVRSLEDETDELSNFAGRVAHDMMGPLSSVGLSLEILARRTAGDPSTEATAQRGLSIVRRASRVVEDLLAFARAGARPDLAARADLKTVLEEVVEGLRLEAVAARVELRLHPVESYLVACSHGVLTSMTSNLIRNAIKHMGDSSIRRVDVRVAVLGERRRVEVVDTGPGVPAALGHQIFEPFVRGNTRSSGAGLGLATVRRLANAHQGQADFRPPEPGQGSLFWFEIPSAVPPHGPGLGSLLSRARDHLPHWAHWDREASRSSE